VKADEAIPRMGQSMIIKPHVPGEPRGALELVEERDNCVVVDSLALNVTADLPNGYPPASQEKSLVLRDVLVKQNHSAGSWS
jgi:hypothetical protein